MQISPIIVLPTAQACWDYGLEREASVDIPLLGSLSPYRFLKGAQFDSKAFKISEAKALGGEITKSIFGPVTKSIVDEVVLQTIWNSDSRNRPEYRVTPRVTDGGLRSYVLQKFPSMWASLQGLLDFADALLGKITIKIAPNWQDSLNFNQSHTWGKPDDFISQGLQQIGMGAERLTRLISSLQRGGGGASSEAFTDYIDRYQGTQKQKITIPFTLFTRNNFERDIYLPLMYLNYITYPYGTNGVDQATQQMQSFAKTLVNSKTIAEFLSEQQRNEANQQIDNSGEFIRDALNQIGVRFYYGQPPNQFIVTHSSGLFKMKKAVVESFNYNFKGPWVKKKYTGAGGIFGADLADRIVGDAYLKNFNFLDHVYPTQCECTLELRETEPWYANDWIDLIRERIGIEKAIKISIQSSTAASAGAGIAAAALSSGPGILPDLRKEPNGNNWVPPGESVSGISGLI